MPKKLEYSEVDRRFKEKGFTLVSKTYEGDSKKLEYICKCGSKAFLTVNRLAAGDNGCRMCAIEKRKTTCLAKYGVDHPRKTKQVRDAAKKTCIEKYGVDNPSKAPEIIQKIRDAHVTRYGVISPMHVKEFVAKQRATIMKNYGVDNPMKSKIIRAKASRTCVERYGVDNPMKVKEFYEKANTSFEKKDYTLPSGTIIKLQGYENYAMDILLKDYEYDEENVKTAREDIPVITYQYKGKICKFYPDIYLPLKNKIIEVKSTYTYLAFEEKNKRKLEAAATQGYKIEYWIFNRQGELEQLIWIPWS